ncbi:hypothetical protein Poli38472_013027 [Pythium oligandrum]|uniref:Nucleotide-diphospho-sugar transferase domain-containing protein n=1 Tax=Pythium oligandrum TaxID=41045 RepID=A0A8K1CJI3_PYTOL|nr:hypothetical protein Poli38472_013027 [Pythium oligandrum]|eukprot:TMW64405.1 hypothetical protein Poli38472_013027 [Pythium oligandrum]
MMPTRSYGHAKRRRHVRYGELALPLPTLMEGILLLMMLAMVLLLGNLLSLRVVSQTRQNVARTLWDLADARAVEPRGIVLPLFDGVALMGMSLVMDLRALHADLPIEVPHCGDLSAHFRDELEQNEEWNVRVYDVCVEAAQAAEHSTFGTPKPLFCDSLEHCHERFRNFDIKILALLFSRFREVMMLDADVLFFQDPTLLWDLDKYHQTGTLFFHDRISFTDEFLAERIKGKPERSRLHEFIERFDRTPFQVLAAVPRPTESAQDAMAHGHQQPRAALLRDSTKYAPSEFLRQSHSWNLRAGHQSDSSVLLWNKHKQPRATAILASFVTLRHSFRPPSYGDKEFYFLACEVAESDYSFSDYGVGSIGWDAKHDESMLCGDALHFFPVRGDKVKTDDDVSPFYINSDHIASWNPDKENLYRSNARLAEFYPGSFVDKNVPQECPFDVQLIPLTSREEDRFRERQDLYREVEEWQRQHIATKHKEQHDERL